MKLQHKLNLFVFFAETHLANIYSDDWKAPII